MPYKDPERQRAYNRRWMQKQRDLCPLCASLKWPEAELCRPCRDDQRKQAASAPLRARTGGRTGISRPQPASHPWRKGLTRAA